jgi:hypothetical protein
VLRIDRHRLGPRVYLLGARVHEWHLGVGLLLGLVVGGLFDRVSDSPATAGAILAGLWLVAKDWRDLFPAQRAPPPGGSACTCAFTRSEPFAEPTRSRSSRP